MFWLRYRHATFTATCVEDHRSSGPGNVPALLARSVGHIAGFRQIARRVGRHGGLVWSPTDPCRSVMSPRSAGRHSGVNGRARFIITWYPQGGRRSWRIRAANGYPGGTGCAEACQHCYCGKSQGKLSTRPHDFSSPFRDATPNSGVQNSQRRHVHKISYERHWNLPTSVTLVNVTWRKSRTSLSSAVMRTFCASTANP
jgi:hypothetical protein